MLSTIRYSCSWSSNPADVYMRKIEMRGYLKKMLLYTWKRDPLILIK